MIIVVVSPCDVDWVQEQLERNNLTRVRVVAGEKTRHRSIYNGVKALKDGGSTKWNKQTTYSPDRQNECQVPLH